MAEGRLRAAAMSWLVEVRSLAAAAGWRANQERHFAECERSMAQREGELGRAAEAAKLQAAEVQAKLDEHNQAVLAAAEQRWLWAAVVLSVAVVCSARRVGMVTARLAVQCWHSAMLWQLLGLPPRQVDTVKTVGSQSLLAHWQGKRIEWMRQLAQCQAEAARTQASARGHVCAAGATLMCRARRNWLWRQAQSWVARLQRRVQSDGLSERRELVSVMTQSCLQLQQAVRAELNGKAAELCTMEARARECLKPLMADCELQCEIGDSEMASLEAQLEQAEQSGQQAEQLRQRAEADQLAACLESDRSRQQAEVELMKKSEQCRQVLEINAELKQQVNY